MPEQEMHSHNTVRKGPQIDRFSGKHLKYRGGRVVRRCWVNFQCWGVLLICVKVGQGPIALAEGAGGGGGGRGKGLLHLQKVQGGGGEGGGLDIFSRLSPSLGYGPI